MSTAPVKRGTFRRSCRRCGWSGEYDTAGRADYAKKRHACQRRIDKAARSAAFAERMAAVDRTPKPCLCKKAQHEHGTYAAYTWDKCRCIPCREATTVYENNRQRQKAYGRWDNLVDAEPVQAHVLSLMAQGMGLKRIAAAAGISNGSATKLIYGHYKKVDGPQRGCKGAGDLVRPPCRRVRKETAEKLLGVTFEYSRGTRVDSTDTARRLQALVAVGWSGQKLANRLGFLRSNFTPLLHGRREVSADTAQRVHALYLELAEQAPPEDSHRDKIAASRARRFARDHGWAPPLKINGKLFTGPALPDPRERLATAEVVELDPIAYDEAAVLRAVDGDRSVHLSNAERREVIVRLHRRGLTDRAITDLTGVHRDQVSRERKELGLAPNPNPEHSGLSGYFSGRSRQRRAEQRGAA